ncbi:MAG: DUF445 domain-containing protein [Treponema sp.]|jgi:uncharacterized membrane protein YheB (UPF0754 family)|nr:DUF445 domain-containing protein [Treponema sp.]
MESASALIVNDRLSFIIAPLAGAVIGYVTNAVAVRMLFRPLTEITVAGIRLPFTPGILPRQRRRLADSIGAMVERELFTPEVISEHLARGDVREKLRGIFLSAAGKKAEQWYSGAVSELAVFLSTPKIRSILESHGRAFINKIILSMNVFQRFFVTAGGYDTTVNEKMPEVIEDLLCEFETMLRSEEPRKKLLSFFGDSLEKAAVRVERDGIRPEQVSAILDSVNVRTLVRDRINKLDMLKVEGIILDLLAGELKWINLFGAVLGALIGAVQVLISALL